MVKILLKKQLTEIFRAYFYDAKKNKARSKAAVTGYIVLFVFLMVGILGGMFTFLSVSLCGALTAVGFDWLYFAIMSLLAILLGAFGSVFNTYSGLYLAKDNDLLLSMPIPVGTIMISRLLGVYLMGLMYSGVHFACAFNFGFCAYRFKCTRLGSGKNKLKAEKQKLYYRNSIAAVFRGLLFCLL